jgi:hypothetical protein
MHAQWLASEAREHSGDETEIRLWQKVIDASIQASANAQDHLLSMQMLDLDKRDAGSAGSEETASCSGIPATTNARQN